MTPKSSYLFLNGLRFHYLDWGGSGQPVVLVHGLASNAHIWSLVAPLLAPHFRVLALDQRNHGRSDPAEGGFDFPTIAKDLHAFIDTLQLERPLLVGHSWGASVVVHYAAKRPTPPSGLVLVDGGVLDMKTTAETWEQAERMLMPPDLDGMPRADFLTRFQQWMPKEVDWEAALTVALNSFAIDEEDRIFRRLPIPKHMQIAHALYDQNIFDLLPRVRCPILACPAADTPRDERGAQFLTMKREGVARAERLHPNFRTVWFENTIHDIPLHRPRELAQTIIDFEHG